MSALHKASLYVNANIVEPLFPSKSNYHQQIVKKIQFLQHVRHCSMKKTGKKSIQQKDKEQHYIFEKVAIDSSKTKHKWEKTEVLPITQIFSQEEIKSFQNEKYEQLKDKEFQIKQQFFRRRVQKLRIDWTEGADIMKLNKQNILVDSLNQLNSVNLHKQLKVEFEGEKTNDAGGVLRQWINMITKEIFEIDLGIFAIGDIEEGICYHLNWDEDIDKDISVLWLTLFGVVIGKAIFDRIPMQGLLDRVILRHLTGGVLRIQDIYGHEKQLYESWNFLKNGSEEQILDSEAYFVYTHKSGGQIKEIELVEGGKQLQVDIHNISLFLDLCMETIMKEKIKSSIENLKEGISRVFPVQFLSIFSPVQLQMIMYGYSNIDLDDWRENTEYQTPYNKNHKVIKWFWEIMGEFDQDQLQNMLQFSTGSTRTPISGFAKLESNRGNYSKFMIVPSEFNKKQNIYPKGYTCFNRLQLPKYLKKQDMKQALIMISKSNLDGVFGLE